MAQLSLLLGGNETLPGYVKVIRKEFEREYLIAMIPE
jgi:hypothetical protein